jgi:MOSC domain-containing protein
MKIVELWRYPVKSMAGERLDGARIDALGIEGDRVVHVEDARGRVVTARTHPQLLGHRAVLTASGEPLVDGALWTDRQARQSVVGIVGQGARLVRDETADRFDVLPLLVSTDGAIARFGYDGRRLRSNIVVGDVEGLAERSWPGHCLRVREVLIGVQDLRGRCVMTTFDPDTLVQDPKVLRRIVTEFGGELALNCHVIRGGEIQVGDTVELVPCRENLRTQQADSVT